MSAIFYQDAAQKELAEKSLSDETKRRRGVTTKVLPLDKFFPAEGYHQKYLLQKHPWLLQALDIDPEDVSFVQ